MVPVASRHNGNGLFVLDVGTHEVRALALTSVDNRFEVVGAASGWLDQAHLTKELAGLERGEQLLKQRVRQVGPPE